MKNYKKGIVKFKTIILKIIDVLVSPFVLLSAYLLRYIRNKGVNRFTVSRAIFRKTGVVPVSDHYYEPFYNPKSIEIHKRIPRNLNGINFDHSNQLNFLSGFNYWDEVSKIIESGLLSDDSSKMHYPWLLPSEAELYYSIIRKQKPSTIIEIGSGISTLVALEGIKKNMDENNDYNCNIYCIEPYENKWLEEAGINLVRKKVEMIEVEFFNKLRSGDILFIDSSHIIKPNGDVLFEYLEILPLLENGVFIHIHDIFTPFNYPDRWIIDGISFWNEQYLLEAFLSYNNEFKIMAALRYLMWKAPEQLKVYLKSLRDYPNQELSSLWMLKSIK